MQQDDRKIIINSGLPVVDVDTPAAQAAVSGAGVAPRSSTLTVVKGRLTYTLVVADSLPGSVQHLLLLLWAEA
jgi:hypothetical protein